MSVFPQKVKESEWASYCLGPRDVALCVDLVALRWNVAARAFDGDFEGNKRGYYQHWGWHQDSDGNRAAHAVPSTDRGVADLISTAYHNKSAPDAVYALVLDVDAERTQPRFLDQDGRVDPRLVIDAFGDQLPLTRYHMTIACRSTSGKGLHLFFSMVPVVLTDTVDSPAEVFALRVQRSLIAAANEIGIGADPSAVGLKRLVANFNNTERVIFRDQKKRTKIENAAKNAARAQEIGDETNEDAQPHHALRIMGKELEAFLRQARREKRLYPENKNVELQYARFLCFVVGWLPEAACAELGQLGFCQGYFKSTDFASVRLTMTELQLIFGDTSAPTIRSLLRSRPELIVSHEKGSRVWEIQANPAYWHLFERASDLVKTGRSEVGRIWNSPWELPEPELVENGFRNQYVVWLMNAYKSRGYSETEALEKIRLRIVHCPNAEGSRTMKRLERKVRNFYRNSPQLHGRYADQPLPNWMMDDAHFCEKRTREVVAPRKKNQQEKNPCSEPLSEGEARGLVSIAGVSVSPSPAFFQDVYPGLRELGFDQNQNEEISSEIAQIPAAKILPNVNESQGTASGGATILKLLAVVRWRQRVGIFDGDHLILASTNSRHFVATRAMENISARPEFAGMEVKFWYPKRTDKRMEGWVPTLESLDSVASASSLFGTKPTLSDAMSDWFEKKGIARTCGIICGHVAGNDEDVPF